MKRSTRRTSVSRSAAVMAALASVAVVAAGCTSSDGEDGQGLSKSKIAEAKASADELIKAPTSIDETTPLSKPAPKGKLIVFLQDSNPVSTNQFKGVADAAAALGWSSKAIKFDPSDISTFNTGLLQALGAGADYVVDSGVPESQLSKSTLAKFKAAGVPIIVLDSTPIPDTDPLHGLPAGPNSRKVAGTKLADWFVADSAGKGHVLNVNVTTYPVLTLFADSFDAEVEKACPACKTTPLKVTYADLASGALSGKIVAALRSDRSIKYAVFDNASEIGGLDAKLKAAGLDDVKLIGHSVDPTTVKSLQSGQAKAFVGYNFTYNGWDAVDAAARLSVGDKPGNPRASTPFRLFTKDNLDELDPSAVYTGPDGALEQFKKLWLVEGS